MVTAKILLGILAGAIALWLRPSYKARAERAFSALSIDSPDSRFCLRGTTAKIVYDRVDSRSGNPYSLFRICKNEHGEYFLFLHDGYPYATHLSRERARHALLVDRKAYEREFGGIDPDAGTSYR
jgi:hypothetical protein